MQTVPLSNLLSPPLAASRGSELGRRDAARFMAGGRLLRLCHAHLQGPGGARLHSQINACVASRLRPERSMHVKKQVPDGCSQGIGNLTLTAPSRSATTAARTTCWQPRLGAGRPRASAPPAMRAQALPPPAWLAARSCHEQSWQPQELCHTNWALSCGTGACWCPAKPGLCAACVVACLQAQSVFQPVLCRDQAGSFLHVGTSMRQCIQGLHVRLHEHMPLCWSALSNVSVSAPCLYERQFPAIINLHFTENGYSTERVCNCMKSCCVLLRRYHPAELLHVWAEKGAVSLFGRNTRVRSPFTHHKYAKQSSDGAESRLPIQEVVQGLVVAPVDIRVNLLYWGSRHGQLGPARGSPCAALSQLVPQGAETVKTVPEAECSTPLCACCGSSTRMLRGWWWRSLR